MKYAFIAGALLLVCPPARCQSRSDASEGQPDLPSEPAPENTLEPPAPEGAPEVTEAPPSLVEEKPVLPVFMAAKTNLNDFTAFADGGWDGNWYIGYNNCWIVRLPPAPPGSFQRAYIGAKIGRAKTRPRAGHAFEQEPIPAKIYMALSPIPSFSAESTFFLTDTRDIPLQSDPNLISGFAGQPGWFWTEVPVNIVEKNGSNYLAIWSDTDFLLTASSSPILAAATADAPSNAWLNHSIHGTPPRDPATALETSIGRLVPALAIKLVPPNLKQVRVRAVETVVHGDETIVRFSAAGENIALAWAEISYDQLSWQRFGPLLRQPPFDFSFTKNALGGRAVHVRGVAVDELGNTGQSDPVAIGKNGGGRR